jgi:hypothetical protein
VKAEETSLVVAALARPAPPRHPHVLFTAGSRPRPIVVGMHINDATSLQPAIAGIFAVSGGRLGATASAVVGLLGTVVGGIALARATGRARARVRAGTAIGVAGGLGGPGGAALAMALGLTGTVLGAFFVATADGGLGTGDGLGGAVLAVVLGLIATVLGGLARARGRQAV